MGSEIYTRVPDLPSGGTDWLAPARLYCSDRSGGISVGAWGANNLGHHVDDAADAVATNRARLLQLPDLRCVQWLNQIHSNRVIYVETAKPSMPSVDAMWTNQPGVGLAILTADCLPVVLADRQGEVVGAAHAGWRGLCAGVLQALVDAMPVPSGRLQAFIGPAIGKAAYEVGEEVLEAFVAAGLGDCAARNQQTAGKFQLDLIQACQQQLAPLGIREVTGGGWCTYDNKGFYSWRRESHRAAAAGQTPITGRQATLVWLPEH